MYFLSLDPVVGLALRLSLALLFASTVAHKLRGFGIFRQTVADYRLLPRGLVTPVALALAAFEMILVLALLLPWTANPGAWAAALLLLFYAGAIVINLARGRRNIDCGCTGPALRQPISEWLVLRNLALVVLAALATQPMSDRLLGVWDFLVILATVASLGLLYVAINILCANAPRLARLTPDYE